MVSNKGNVKSLPRVIIRSDGRKRTYYEKILKPGDDRNGYKHVSLVNNKARKTTKIHRLVALYFINNPNNYNVVNHIDGNKHNNNVENLEWCTHSYNNKHALHSGLRKIPTKLTDEQREEILENGHYKPYRQIAKDYDVSERLIRYVLKYNGGVIYEASRKKSVWNTIEVI